MNTTPASTETPALAASRFAKNALKNSYCIEALHAYGDTEGNAIYWRIRAKHPDGTKWIRPMHLSKGSYAIGEPASIAGSKPLYKLEQSWCWKIIPVFICEGEKACDALNEIGIAATTSGGAESADSADWTALAHLKAIIWPDNDEAGRRYAEAVAKRLSAINCMVHIIDVSQLNLPDRGDAFDWIRRHPTATCDDIDALPLVSTPQSDNKPKAPVLNLVQPRKETLDEAVARLALLPILEYELCRDREAKKLDVRVSVLDKVVEAGRDDCHKAENERTNRHSFQECSPWPEPVNVELLLNELSATLQKFIVLPKHTDTLLALWALFTWVIDYVGVAPILAVTSPEKRCGKSTVVQLLQYLVRRPLAASNITAAALFRTIEAWEPTLLIDEADTFLAKSDEMRGVLNSGHTRGSAFVIRTVGDEHEPTRFSTSGAKAIACIGALPNTLADRSLEVSLKRRLPGEYVEKLRHAEPAVFVELNRKCSRFASDFGNRIRKSRPTMPDCLNDRAADNWEPLFAIADIAGGSWTERVRIAAQDLAAGNDDIDDDSVRVQLLQDIRQLLDKCPGEVVASKELIASLVEMEERPWSESNRGRPINGRWLAVRLRSFGIASRTRRQGAETFKGYAKRDFDDCFVRYLGATSVTPPQVRESNALEESSIRHIDDSLRIEDAPNSLINRECDAVTDTHPPKNENTSSNDIPTEEF